MVENVCGKFDHNRPSLKCENVTKHVGLLLIGTWCIQSR